MKKLSLLLVMLWLTLPLLARADQLDPRLDELFQKLHDADDAGEAAGIEAMIWQVWSEHDNPEYANLMLTGIAQMNQNSLSAALNTFNRLTEIAPDFAEAWNKRATLHFLLRDYAASEADIAKTLALEPFHFGALSGRGLVYMAQQKYDLARNSFSAALEVNPNMPAVRNNLKTLDDYFRRSAI